MPAGKHQLAQPLQGQEGDEQGGGHPGLQRQQRQGETRPQRGHDQPPGRACASTRSSTNSTVGADLLPGVAQHLAFHVEAARGKRQRLLDGGDDLGAAGMADMARHPSRPEGVFGRGERLGQALGDEAGDRAVEDHPQPDVVDVPAHDVQRVGPHVRHPCPDRRRGRVARPQHRRGGAVAEHPVHLGN